MTNAAKPRRLLLVTYWYPPAVGAAAERMHSFAKYLPAHGWEVRVLTAHHGDVSDANVIAIPDPWRRREGPIADFEPHPTRGHSLSARLRGWLRELVFPDRFVRWQRAARADGLALIRAWKPDLMLATFPPASAVELALRLHRETGVPFVLDYRDKWLSAGGYNPARPAMREKHLRLEADALAAASGITAVSQALLDDTLALRANAVRNNFTLSPVGQSSTLAPALPSCVILNGFTADATLPDTTAVSALRGKDPRLLVSHVGTVIPRNRPDLFFNSLPALNNPDVCFRFVGNLSLDFLRRAGLAGLVETTGLVDRHSAATEIAAADVLLLLTGDYVGRWGLSAKLFAYLASGKPIICLEEKPGSNDAAVLQELAPTRSFIGTLGDAKSLAGQLTRVRSHIADSPKLPACDQLALYSRKTQAARLGAFLMEL